MQAVTSLRQTLRSGAAFETSLLAFVGVLSKADEERVSLSHGRFYPQWNAPMVAEGEGRSWHLHRQNTTGEMAINVAGNTGH